MLFGWLSFFQLFFRRTFSFSRMICGFWVAAENNVCIVRLPVGNYGIRIDRNVNKLFDVVTGDEISSSFHLLRTGADTIRRRISAGVCVCVSVSLFNDVAQSQYAVEKIEMNTSATDMYAIWLPSSLSLSSSSKAVYNIIFRILKKTNTRKSSTLVSYVFVHSNMSARACLPILFALHTFDARNDGAAARSIYHGVRVHYQKRGHTTNMPAQLRFAYRDHSRVRQCVHCSMFMNTRANMYINRIRAFIHC